MSSYQLPLIDDAAVVRSSVPPRTALETDFPAGALSAAAERESWRKEVHRPATHTHKWWAQRLGTVFRGILAAAVTETREEALAAYSGRLQLPGLTVADCFIGSGTTVVEAAKLGATVIGRDINPVATLVSRQALATWDRAALVAAFKGVEGRVRGVIDELHQTEAGEPVLYYFWVALANCRTCSPRTPPVELFSNYVFAKHAYPKSHPTARATCPNCHAVITVNLSTDQAFTCEACGHCGSFRGPVSGAWMTCPAGHRGRVVHALNGQPPRMRMYAKLVLAADGQRRYDSIDSYDLDLYARAERQLAERRHHLLLPIGQLDDGYNTRQAIGWGYKRWDQFFNARQLLSLGVLAEAVSELPDTPEREALATLFSGTLEFNNLFCSFKGEGTGAVRHMFSHHILKPERTPLEAHPWGTPASSGSFSTLFKSRLLRALDYKQQPHDLVPSNGGAGRVYGLSQPLMVTLGTAAETLAGGGKVAYVSFGNSAEMDLPDNSIDLLITDPPFMDNVHYSELADFFHSWLRSLRPYADYPDTETTRDSAEVQSTDSAAFGRAVEAVWTECARLLKPTGLLAFTFHQARATGWVEVMRALEAAGLVVTAIQPVKAEMSTSSTKSAAADPSNLDSIVVCRPAGHSDPAPGDVSSAEDRALRGLRECLDAGVAVGYSDVQSVVRGSVLALHTIGIGGPLDVLTIAADAAVERVAVALEVTSGRGRTK